MKSKVDKLDVDKLLLVPADLSKLSDDQLKIMLLKRINMMNWLKRLVLFKLLILVNWS